MPETDIRDQTGWRGSREIWLEAAKSALLDGGVDAVKVQPLAQGLNLSRTSFYWFFKDRTALLDALLEDWEQTNTAALLEGCAAYSETIAEAVLNLIGVFLDETRFEPRFDMAVRAWAHQSEAVNDRVTRNDDARLSAIRAMFARFGFSEDDADVRARTIYLVQVGYISLQTRESLAARMDRVPAYVKTFSGQVASPQEIARFHARLGFHAQVSMG